MENNINGGNVIVFCGQSTSEGGAYLHKGNTGPRTFKRVFGALDGYYINVPSYGEYNIWRNGKWESRNFLDLPRKKKKAVKKRLIYA